MSELTECKPVAYMDEYGTVISKSHKLGLQNSGSYNIPLYTSPLTQEEMRQVLEALIRGYHGTVYQLAHLNQISQEAAYDHKDSVRIRKQIAILKGHLK